MPICVECGAEQPNGLLAKRQGVLVVQPCHHCGCCCDTYIEHDTVHTALLLTLQRPAAWRHAVFNTDECRPILSLTVLGIILHLMVTVILAAQPEVVIEKGPNSNALVSLNSATPQKTNKTQPLKRTLVLVELFGGIGSGKNFPSIHMPPSMVFIPASYLLPYAILENVLLAFTLVWVASFFLYLNSRALERSPDGTVFSSSPLRSESPEKSSFRNGSAEQTHLLPRFTLYQGVRAFGIVQASYSLFVLWLIWELPFPLLLLVELTNIAWYCVALQTLSDTAGSPWSFVAGIVTNASVKVVFRAVTKWAVPLIWMPATLFPVSTDIFV